MGTTERLVMDLPSELVIVLREAVERGDFGSESEAVCAILWLWHGHGDLEEDVAELREIVAEGMAEIDAGEFFEADQVHAELRAQIEAIADRRK
jgi:Arc/MetJ-type ribon-helix-helix transcriptional regulator